MSCLVDFHREFPAQPAGAVMGSRREVNARRKDGTQFPVEIGLTPIEPKRGIRR